MPDLAYYQRVRMCRNCLEELYKQKKEEEMKEMIHQELNQKIETKISKLYTEKKPVNRFYGHSIDQRASYMNSLMLDSGQDGEFNSISG